MVRESRAGYMARLRAAHSAARADLEAFFEAGHVEPGRDHTGERDAIRLAPSDVRTALYGPAGCGRVEPDVWLELVRHNAPGIETMDDAVDHVARLVGLVRTYSRAVAIGAGPETVRNAALTLAADASEGDLICALYAGTLEESAQALDMIRTSDVLFAEMTCPRLKNSDPELVAHAEAAAEKMLAAEEVLEQVRAERDAMLVQLRLAGWGYDRIARGLKMSKQRVVQLCQGLPVPARGATTQSDGDLEEF